MRRAATFTNRAGEHVDGYAREVTGTLDRLGRFALTPRSCSRPHQSQSEPESAGAPPRISTAPPSPPASYLQELRPLTI